MSQLQQTINEYLKQLRQRERSAEDALKRAHAGTLAEIRPALQKIYDDIVEKQTNGEEIRLHWLYEANRLETIKQFISGRIDQFAAMVWMRTGQLMRDMAYLGIQAGHALLNKMVPVGVSWSFGVPSLTAIKRLVGALQPDSPLAKLFRGFGEEAARHVGQALIIGVTLGWNPRRIAPLVQNVLEVSRHRALVISRTEGIRAYRDGSLETYRHNSDTVMRYQRVAALSQRTCMACIVLNARVYNLKTDFASHPCCRCTLVPITKSWKQILGPLGIDTSNIPDTTTNIPSGIEWFKGQDEQIQRSMMGKSKYEAWVAGEFELENLAKVTNDPEWGPGVRERSLKELVKT